MNEFKKVATEDINNVTAHHSNPLKQIFKNAWSNPTIFIELSFNLIYLTHHCVRFATTCLQISNFYFNLCTTKHHSHASKLNSSKNYLTVSEHTAIITRQAILHHGQPSNLEQLFLQQNQASTK